jgi:transcriptional regulator with XRE-family HTH domain
MSDFAERFSAILDDKGWDQAEAAAKLGIAQSMVSNYRRAKREPSLDVLLKIARAFGVPLDELIRAPGPLKLKEARAEYGENVQINRWFRQLRLTWLDHPEERARIELGLRATWPNQARDILAWLKK